MPNIKTNRGRAEYRSAIRSRRLIRDAYIELMQEKQMEKISVSDIVRLADLNRGTFYAHYSTPLEVRDEIADEIVSAINEILVGFKFTHFLQNPRPLFDNVEKLLSENFDFYRSIVFHTASIGFTEKVKKILIDYIASDESVPSEIKEYSQFYIALELFAGGVISVYMNYVQGNLKVPIKQITETVCMLIVEASKSLFEPPKEAE